MPDDVLVRLSRPVILLLWALALPALLVALGTPVVQRTQEARVLETGREMLVSGDWRQWMVPKLNGVPRLQKPPLAYWVAAGSFKLFGVGEFAGRLPFAVAGWLTLAVVYLFGRDLKDARYGLMSAAVLLTSFMFFRHFRLAETDSLVAFFVAAGMYALWKGGVAATERRGVAWFQLGGVAIGLAVMAKGPPAVFPLLFFLAWVAVERRRGAVVRMLLSGAMLTALVVGGAWFFYIYRAGQFRVLREELLVIAKGEDHIRPFYMYLPLLFLITAPWTGLFAVGIVEAVRGWRRSEAARVALLWLAVVLVPLCFMGNKQNHYLVPLTPALAMLAAYALERAMDGSSRAARYVTFATIALSAVSAAGVVVVARQTRGATLPLDGALAMVIVAGVMGALSLGRRYGVWGATMCYAGATAVAWAVTVGRWWPSLHPVDHRTIARDLRGAFGQGPYAFYGRDPSFPLIWNLRAIVPTAATPDDLVRMLDAAPTTVVIAQTKNNRPPPPIPEELKEMGVFETGDEGMSFRIYRMARP